MKFKIGISIGDINGIGPEVAMKSIIAQSTSLCIPVLISPKNVLQYYSDLFNLGVEIRTISEFSEQTTKTIYYQWDEEEDSALKPDLGKITAASGLVSMKSIQQGIKGCLNSTLSALVTAPISKEAVNLAGFKIPGHTEYLASETNTSDVLMMLVNNSLRVSLVTTHIPISSVSESITAELISSKLDILHKSLRNDFGIPEPKIAVFGLNPHAGDGGVIGSEEIDIISPVLKMASSKGINAHGPYAADGFFGQKLHEKFDGILAMYHDQGLAPFKLLSFGSGVNFTAGLPIIRTSPDHGTAFDIAGKNLANPSSFMEAYQLAEKLVLQKYD